VGLEFETVLEWELGDEAQLDIVALLEACFPGVFEGRTYFKQVPGLRVLAYEDGVLIGHLALEHRVVRVGDAVLRILGIVDLAVVEASRGRGVGAGLLGQAEEIARRAGIGFLVAMADRHDLYLAQGFHGLERAQTRFLAVEDRASHSLVTRDLADIFLVKPLGEVSWPSGEVDLLGHLF